MVDTHQARSASGGVAAPILANEPQKVPPLRSITSSWFTHKLMVHATGGVSAVPGLQLIGTAADKAGILSFDFKGFTTKDTAY